MESLRGKIQLLASHVFVLRSPSAVGATAADVGGFEQFLTELRDNFFAMCLRMPAGGAEDREVRASAAAAVAGAAWPAEDCPIKEDI